MSSLTWFMSIMTLLAMDTRTGAIVAKDAEPRRCYHCVYTNTTDCTTFVLCPTAQPYCATTATAPDFASTLACAAPTTKACTLSYRQHILQLNCVCSGQLCNTPFSNDLTNKLHNISTFYSLNGSIEFTINYLAPTNLAFVSNEQLYDFITGGVNASTEPTNIARNLSDVIVEKSLVPVVNHTEAGVPRAEALKQEVAIPSDDDDDEGEGSGSYDDVRSQRRPASAPAPPSSFLPANENKANMLSLNIVLSSFLLYSLIV